MTANGANISVRELARRLGVSTATVSRALNNHPEVSERTRTRVLELADETGYHPRVGRRHDRVVGLVYPSGAVEPEVGSFESALLAGVMRGLGEQQYDLTLIAVERDKMVDETYRQFFRRKHVRGVIVRPIAEGAGLAERIAEEGFPCVVVADRSEDPAVNYVCCESGEDSARAVEHLAELGHKRIALVVHDVVDSDHQDRIDGFRRGIRASGLSADGAPELLLPASLESGAEAIDRLLALPEPPTAVYFTNPMPTIGALRRCLELGMRVPDELSIVGFDDSDARERTYPRYTAVCQDACRLGYEASNWLTRTIEGLEQSAMRLRHPTRLDRLETTGSARVEAGAVRAGSPA